jgi:RHS repeat-associated protein
MTYDAVGNILSMTANIPNAATQYSGVTNYSYQDNRSQLSLEQSTRNNGYNHIFEYDTMGNPTVFAGITKSYNSKNQYITGGFAYDANGNPTTYKNHTLTFDPENRMTSFGNILSAGYTGGGLRAWKQSASGRTYFLYSGNSPVCELNNSGDVVAVDTFGPTGLLARREGSSTQGNSKFYTFDPQGNVSLTLNANGSVTSIHLYDAFGKSLYGAAEFPYSFGAQYGYYTDQDTGLQLLGHRYYDSEDGRFVTRDPIGYAGGMNLYSYVQNNPVNMIDPSGYCSIGTKSWWQNLKEGRYFGTTQGESAQGWYAQKSVEHPWNPAYWIGGTLSSLWTPDTYMETVATLSGAYELRGFGVAAKIIQGSGGAGKVYGLVEFGTSKVDYIGQTINVSARETYWRSIYPNHELVVMAENLSKVEADGVEQVFIEGYGGPNGISCGNSNRGTLFNKINKINPKRPYYITATDAAYNILLK